jgi:hypothetical protein
MGYGWQNAYFRLVPQDGPPTTIPLATAFAWCGGPLKTEVTPEAEQLKRVGINRDIHTETLGHRYKIAFTFAIGGSMADHAALAAIVSALSKATGQVFLSMDGQTEREVRLASNGYGQIKPFNGKPFAGAEFTLAVETVSIEDWISPIRTGVL